MATERMGSRARVQVGTYTTIASGPDLEPVPIEDQRPEPVYLRSRAEIDRHEKQPERRERFYRELDEDRQAIEEHPLKLAADAAEARNDEAMEAWGNVYREALCTRPTTAAGALAFIATFEARDKDMMPDWDLIRAIFDGVRAVIVERA
ncbi:hypothetical protein JNW90_30715 [Micromonospora sp. STR1s_5]|nr:hypothetical protein [Micromonospora sp. STR1s_5]